jgi:hypothetical protein
VLEDYRQVFRLKHDVMKPPGNLQRLTKQITRSRSRVDFINEAYDEEVHKNASKITYDAFESEILEGIAEINECYRIVHANRIF